MTRRRFLWLSVVCLLLVAASRTTRISDLDLDAHENYAVAQSNGSFDEIARWTPYDWGAASFLALGAWQALVGSDPVVLRYLSVLLFVWACACVYAVMRRLAGSRAALLAILIYAAPLALIQLSLFTRGYALLIALLPFTLHVALRYERRPSLPMAAAMAICLAALVYIHVSGLFAAAMIGFFMLGRGGLRSIRRWLAPGIAFALLVTPELFGKADAASARFSSFRFGLDAGQLQELLAFVTGTPVLAVLWASLVAAALIGLLRRPRPRSAWLLLAWSGLGLLLMFTFGGLIGSPRSSWWYLLPSALWIAWGMARLPRAMAGGAALLAMGMAFAPIERLNWIDDSAFANPPLFENFRWLKQNARWGDVMLVDPTSVCAPFPDEWDNAVRTYFPNGLRFVSDPTGYARVWYVTSNGWNEPEVRQAVETQRIASIFVGPPECLFRLYAGPPDPMGVLFENGLRFHGVEVLKDDQLLLSPLVLHRAEPVRIRLWWSVDHPLSADYSIAVHIYDEGGGLIAQSDGAPQLVSLSPVAPPPSSEMISWQVDQMYAEERTLAIPALERAQNGLRSLNAMLIVYQWWDGARIAAPGTDGETRLPLLSIDVRSF